MSDQSPGTWVHNGPVLGPAEWNYRVGGVGPTSWGTETVEGLLASFLGMAPTCFLRTLCG